MTRMVGVRRFLVLFVVLQWVVPPFCGATRPWWRPSREWRSNSWRSFDVRSNDHHHRGANGRRIHAMALGQRQSIQTTQSLFNDGEDNNLCRFQDDKTTYSQDDTNERMARRWKNPDVIHPGASSSSCCCCSCWEGSPTTTTQVLLQCRGGSSSTTITGHAVWNGRASYWVYWMALLLSVLVENLATSLLKAAATRLSQTTTTAATTTTSTTTIPLLLAASVLLFFLGYVL